MGFILLSKARVIAADTFATTSQEALVSRELCVRQSYASGYIYIRNHKYRYVDEYA